MEKNNAATAQSPLMLPAAQLELDHKPPILAFDPEKYQRFLDGSGWSDEQKLAYLEAIWKIMLCWVDLAFRTSAVPPLHDNTTLELDSPQMLGCDSTPQTFGILSADNANAQSVERMES